MESKDRAICQRVRGSQARCGCWQSARVKRKGCALNTGSKNESGMRPGPKECLGLKKECKELPSKLEEMKERVRASWRRRRGREVEGGEGARKETSPCSRGRGQGEDIPFPWACPARPAWGREGGLGPEIPLSVPRPASELRASRGTGGEARQSQAWAWGTRRMEAREGVSQRHGLLTHARID